MQAVTHRRRIKTAGIRVGHFVLMLHRQARQLDSGTAIIDYSVEAVKPPKDEPPTDECRLYVMSEPV